MWEPCGLFLSHAECEESYDVASVRRSRLMRSPIVILAVIIIARVITMLVVGVIIVVIVVIIVVIVVIIVVMEGRGISLPVDRTS